MIRMHFRRLVSTGSMRRRRIRTNEGLLKQISDMTGGRFNPSPEEVFDSGGRTIYSDCSFGRCLFLAIGLTIAELVIRKWTGLVQRFQRT